MRLPRTRGAISGLVLVLAGLWAAFVPFIGPYLNLSIGTDTTWHWTTDRLWLDVVPGAVAVLGGLMLLSAVTRARAGLGAWLAVCAGTWLVVGQSVSFLWHHGTSAAGQPLFGNAQKAFEELVYFYGIGALILFFGAFALGRLALPAATVPVEEDVATTTAVAPRRRRWFGRRRRVATDEGVVEGPATDRPVAADEPTVVQPTREPAE